MSLNSPELVGRTTDTLRWYGLNRAYTVGQCLSLKIVVLDGR